MNNSIDRTVAFVKETLKNSEAGHDWWHIYRVWNMAKAIAKIETCNLFIVEMAALLHDIADSKFHAGNEEVGPKMARDFLQNLKLDPNTIEEIIQIIRHVSFKGGNFEVAYSSKEFHIVQDADRLDAIGAIGIARTFNYGGFKNRELYNPTIKPNLNMTREEYKSSYAPTINHFYEKLLLLKDRMNTTEGRRIAKERHVFMEHYLTQFFKEWNTEY